MTVSLPSGGKGMGQFVHNVMYSFKNKKQTEELNSSPNKETSFSFKEKAAFLQNLYFQDLLSSHQYALALEGLLEESSKMLPASGSTIGDFESDQGSDMNNFIVQSDVDHVEGTANTTEQVNVHFKDNEEEDLISKEVVNQLYTPTTSLNADIGKFLCRPTLIDETTWALGATVDRSIDPWHLFFNRASIKRKIDNYAFIRCDLHLKFVINASPFYYGAIINSYHPCDSLLHSANLPAGRANRLVGYSQRPNLMVYPQNCEGGEMILPFVYPYEWLRLTSAQDLTDMGTINIDSFGVLSTVGTATGPITMQIYAWAENVTMAGLTIDLAVQSGTYHKGPLSKPASAVARASGMLSNIPVIGSFMTATSIAAQSVADVAGLFGYTKVPVLNDVHAFKNLPFHGLATAEVSDCTERLCIDSKNEMTIDTSVIGDVDSNALDISSFVQRKSFLNDFTWQVSDASETLLWNSYVTPFLAKLEAGTGQTIINGTPMWLAANLFDYWRGDIIFDLKIICTQYHKGRLRISWDPVGDIANTSETSTEVYTSIVDISEETEVSFRIPYTQRTAYQKIPFDMNAVMYGLTPLAVDTTDIVNGIFTVRVLNELSAPISVADVNILVSVRGAENLEFAAPKEISADLSYYTVQSEETFAGTSTVDPNLNLIYIGEKVVNFRSLMMRCNFSRADSAVSSLIDDDYFHASVNRRPIYKGFDPKGISEAVSNISGGLQKPCNFAKNTPYHMISQCFLGERGSFTWKFDLDAAHPTSITVSRPKIPLSAAAYKYSFIKLDPTVGHENERESIITQNTASTSGLAVINQLTNTGLSVNLPQYSIVSFLDTAPASRTEGLSNISGNDNMRIAYIARRTFDPAAAPAPLADYMSNYFQVGPDYAPVFFLNVPTMFVYLHEPVPWV